MSNTVELARRVAALGDGADKVLVHLPRRDAALLARLSGGSVNKKTGLPQFGFFSSITGALGLGGGGGSNPGGTAYNEIAPYATPFLKTGDSLLGNFNSGTLTAGDQQALTASTNSQKASLNQLYGSMGLGKSSMLTNQLNNVQNNEVSQRQAILNSYLTQAEGAFSTGIQPYVAAVGYQFQGSQQAQSLLSGAIGNIFGSGGAGSNLLGGLFGGGGGSGSFSPGGDLGGGDTSIGTDLGGAVGDGGGGFAGIPA